MRYGVLAGALLMATLPCSVQAQHDGYRAPVPPTPTILRHQLIDAFADIRQEGLKRQADDGGRLTPAHRDDLQDKIDAAERRYADKMRRYEFTSPRS